jgi:hypothetical protein
MKSRNKIMLIMLGTVLLVSVFLMYSRPDFLLQMANQMWVCF